MEWWDILSRTVASEFSDIPDFEHAIRVSVRLVLAAFLGGVLGYEREYKGKAAGLRTHMLVSLGAALFVLVPLEAGMPIEDLSRVMQGIITGIGFLGAGTILKGSSVQDVKGLTTAAGIWLTAAIGVATGLGHESTAVMTTAFALVIFLLMPRLEQHAAHKSANTDKRGRDQDDTP